MKAIPQYSDFELDYKKFPKRQVGGISDMNAVRRMDYRDSMFEKAKDEWMIDAERQIHELKDEFRDILAQLEPKDIGYSWEDWGELEHALKK